MYNYSSYNDLSAVMAGLGAIIILVVLIALAVVIFYLVALWKVFKKAGKNGWEAIVPFYNSWILVEIAGLNWWWFLIMISGTIVSLLSIPGLSALCQLANLVATFFVNYNIAKKLHKEVGFAILATLFPVIMYPIIAFSNNYQFDQSVEVSPNGPIGDNNNQTSSTTQNTASVNNNSENTENSRFCTKCGTKTKGNEKFCTNCGNKLD